jgi:N6-adenosine-specific RNA methylase IME4
VKLVLTRRQWAKRIAAKWQAMIGEAREQVFAIGRDLIDSKQQLGHGQWLLMVEQDVPFSRSTAWRLMEIAGHPVLSNVAHAQHLPSGWYTLYELTKLDETMLCARIEDGTIHVGMERRDAAKLRSKVVRRARHLAIRAGALAAGAIDKMQRFPLIYADPPWTFATYSAEGADKTPEQHYPVMSDEEIMAYDLFAHEDAALFLWCTSSNVHRALKVMATWGFAYKTHAVWVKLGESGAPIPGMGLVFRNAHELLLYGTRGKMPGPQYQPLSVLMYPRGGHSTKPAEVRKEIERMYPDFDARTRIEHFARGPVDGWTVCGYESKRRSAA